METKKLSRGWVESFGKQLGEIGRAAPVIENVSKEAPELVEARSAGLKRYWEQVRSGERTRKPRGSKK